MKRPAASHDANAGGVDGKGAGGVGLAWLQTQTPADNLINTEDMDGHCEI